MKKYYQLMANHCRAQMRAHALEFRANSIAPFGEGDHRKEMADAYLDYAKSFRQLFFDYKKMEIGES